MGFTVEVASSRAANVVEATTFVPAGRLETTWSAAVTLDVDGVDATVIIEGGELIAGHTLEIWTVGISIPIAPFCDESRQKVPPGAAPGASGLIGVECGRTVRAGVG